MILLFQPGNFISTSQFFLGFSFALIISAISFKLKFLTLSGSIATFVLAFLIFVFGSWGWTIPILTFFITSSILSALREKKNSEVSEYFEKSGTRDFMQVFANGGSGGILVLMNYFFPNKIWFLVYSGMISSACADSWATEIGTMSKHKTYDILSFKKIEQGQSGGVSIAGLSGAFAGSLLIALISVLMVESVSFTFILLITSAGFVSSIFDSVLGSTVQSQFKCSICGRIIDNKIHCNTFAVKYSGIKFFNNDLVNLASGIFAALFIFSLNSL